MGRQPSVHTAASLFQNICYQNKDALSAGIIVAGWDQEGGPSVYNIPLGGGIFRQPWAIGGSGSTYVYGYCDATFQDGWGKDETIEFVKNSTWTSLDYEPNSTTPLNWASHSTVSGNGTRRFVRRCDPYVRYHRKRSRTPLRPRRPTTKVLARARSARKGVQSGRGR